MLATRVHRYAAAALTAWMACATHAAGDAPADAAGYAAQRAAAVHAAAERIGPAVVRVQVIGDFSAEAGLEASGATTGLWVGDGLVLTSVYGLERSPSGFVVEFPAGERSAARLLGADANRRVALLRVATAPDGFDPTWGVAPGIEVGQTAVAVGRAIDRERVQLSVGVVSATRRLHGRAVQTDAPLSPANYGGPLVDLDGRVVGIVTPLAPDGASGAEWYDSGVGFAAPIDQVLTRLPRLEQGDIAPGWLGAAFAKGHPGRVAPRVRRVLAGGPAAEAGLKADDLIVSVEDAPVATLTDLRFALRPLDAGDPLRLTVDRKGQRAELRVVLGAKRGGLETSPTPPAETPAP